MNPVNEDKPASREDFPTVRWGAGEAAFTAATTLPAALPPISAALVFAMQGADFLLADIAGRGWCIPGGRLEAGEAPDQAARREAWEEAGATLGPLRLLGYYVLTNGGDGTQTAVPTYLSAVTALDAIPNGTESRGVRLTAYAELSRVYFLWDALIAAVFALAYAAATDEAA